AKNFVEGDATCRMGTYQFAAVCTRTSSITVLCLSGPEFDLPLTLSGCTTRDRRLLTDDWVQGRIQPVTVQEGWFRFYFPNDIRRLKRSILMPGKVGIRFPRRFGLWGTHSAGDDASDSYHRNLLTRPFAARPDQNLTTLRIESPAC